MPTANVYNIDPAKIDPVIEPQNNPQLSAKFKPSVDIAKGTLVGEYESDPGVYGPYDHTAANGLQVLKGLTSYRVVTDANGLITNIGGPLLSQNLSMPVHAGGYFACEDVANAAELDDAIAAGYCTLIRGNATTGVFRLL